MDDPTLQTAPPTGAWPEEDPLADTPYRFVRRIGEGGMGEVIEAEHVPLGHRVAIKLLHPEYFARFELKERMRVEAQACARIRHENLVPVTDFGETLDGRAFLVMERLYGRSLGDELHARGFLPVVEAVDIACQALAGLAAAHAAALVHRDVKPDNLFLCDQAGGARRVKVLDFGIAKILGHARNALTPAAPAQPTADGIVVGTPRWASPEQSRGDADIDARSDVYSMGWVLYTMLTGSAPFPHLRTNGELFAAHSKELPPPPSTVAPQPIPPALDAIVRRAMAKRRDDRFPSAEAFRAALAPFLTWTATLAAGPAPQALSLASTELAPSRGPAPAVAFAPAVTADISEVAIARPVLPWARAAHAALTPARPPSTPAPRRLPAWFFAVVVLGVGVILALATLHILHAR